MKPSKIMLTCIIMLLFCIFLQATSLRITAPNRRETLQLGSDFTITWDEVDVTGTGIVLHLFKGRTQLGTIKRGISLGIKAHPWKVGELQDRTGRVTPTPGSDYKIRARVMGTTTVDFSDSSFTISPAPSTNSLEITLPHSGDNSWQLGSTHTVRWKSIGPFQVKLELVQKGQEKGVIYYGPNIKTWQWHIKNYLNGDPIRNGTYQLRITCLFPPLDTHQVTLHLIHGVDYDL